MDAFTLEPNFALMILLPVFASIAGVLAIIVGRYLKEIVADAMGSI